MFSRISLRTYLRRKSSRLGHALPVSVNDRVTLPFRENLIFPKLCENKILPKIIELIVYVAFVCRANLRFCRTSSEIVALAQKYSYLILQLNGKLLLMY